MFLIESVATTTLLSALVYLDRRISLDGEGELGGNVRCLDCSLEKNADCHFCYGLGSCGRISFYLVDSDVVLAIAGACY